MWIQGGPVEESGGHLKGGFKRDETSSRRWEVVGLLAIL